MTSHLKNSQADEWQSRQAYENATIRFWMRRKNRWLLKNDKNLNNGKWWSMYTGCRHQKRAVCQCTK